MGMRKCCIENCSSRDTIEEEPSFTFHKFPKKSPLKAEWIKATRTSADIDKWIFVCSKHFSDDNFQTVRGSKSYLKNGAVPSIFPWTTSRKREPRNSNEDTTTPNSNAITEDISSSKRSKKSAKESKVIFNEPQNSNTIERTSTAIIESPTNSSLRSSKVKKAKVDNVMTLKKSSYIEDLSPNKINLKSKRSIVPETSPSSTLRSHKIARKTAKSDIGKNDSSPTKQKKTTSVDSLSEDKMLKSKSVEKANQSNTDSGTNKRSPRKKLISEGQSGQEIIKRDNEPINKYTQLEDCTKTSKSEQSPLHKIFETFEKGSLKEIIVAQKDAPKNILNTTELDQATPEIITDPIDIMSEKEKITSEEENDIVVVSQIFHGAIDSPNGNELKVNSSSNKLGNADDDNNISHDLEVSTKTDDPVDTKKEITSDNLNICDVKEPLIQGKGDKLNNVLDTVETKITSEITITPEQQTDPEKIEKPVEGVEVNKSNDTDENLHNFTLSLDDSKDVSNSSNENKSSNVSKDTTEITILNDNDDINESIVLPKEPNANESLSQTAIETTISNVINTTDNSEIDNENQGIDESKIANEIKCKIDKGNDAIDKSIVIDESIVADNSDTTNAFQDTEALKITGNSNIIDDTKMDIDDTTITDGSRVSDTSTKDEFKFTTDCSEITEKSEDGNKSANDTADSVKLELSPKIKYSPTTNESDVSQLSSFDDTLPSKCDLMINSKLNEISVCDDSLMSPNKYSTDKGASQPQPLNVGSRVEVSDFGNISHVAVILEVDYEEMEVLLQYDEPSQKQNEWISVYSTRLRSGLSAGETLMNTMKAPDPSFIQLPKKKRRLKKDIEPEPPVRKYTKKKDRTVTYAPGERCLARWTNNRRFQATIREVLDNGQYKVIFDDGFMKICNPSTLFKLKRARGRRSKPLAKLPVAVTPGQGATPVPYSQQNLTVADIPDVKPPETPIIFHRHLFDPNLDYLGSKKERREMKRKLNVKDLFNFHKKVTAEEKKDSQRTKQRKKRPIVSDREESPVRSPPKKKQRRRIKKGTPADISLDVEEVKHTLESPSAVVEKPKKPVVEEMTLAPGEWCCKWLNGEPVGMVSELEPPPPTTGDTSTPRLNKKSVQVEDLRLPPNWTKHMLRRSVGSSAGKWDVLILSPEGVRFRNRAEIRAYLEAKNDEALKEYESCLSDFSVHRKRSRQMGWDVTDPTLIGLEGAPTVLPAGSSPVFASFLKQQYKKKKSADGLAKIRKLPKIKLSVPRSKGRPKERKKLLESHSIDLLQSPLSKPPPKPELLATPDAFIATSEPIEDGYVYVGSCKVQVIDNLLRCPKDGCLKNFRKDNLLQMHIKHYHRELIPLLGTTPKVLDLAYARTVGTPTEELSTPKLQRAKVRKPAADAKFDVAGDYESSQQAADDEPWSDQKAAPKTDVLSPATDSPKLRSVLETDANPPKKHFSPYSKKHADGDKSEKEEKVHHHKFQVQFSAFHNMAASSPRSDRSASEKDGHLPKVDQVGGHSQAPDAAAAASGEFDDLEDAIKSHTVSKPPKTVRKGKHEKRRPTILAYRNGPMRRKRVATGCGGTSRISLNDVWGPQANDADETRSSFGLPEQQSVAPVLPKKEAKPEESNQSSKFITEGGERIKIVHMKREEIINCACGYNEEDGLMIQCELCLCWQHAICHCIETESQVPEKYVCYICINPKRGRRSQRFLHDQSWLYEGVLPSWKAVASASPADASQRASALKKSFELSGNLYLIAQALHAIKVKMHVAKKKDHPKLYLWSKPWDPPGKPPNVVVEQLGDINAMMGQQLGKENCPMSLKVDDLKSVMRIDPPDINQMKNPMSSDDAGDNQVIQSSSDELAKVAESQLNVQGSASNLLVNFLASPGGTSIDLPISTSELETLAKSVQDCEAPVLDPTPPAPSAPEPEAAIDPVKCREQLHEHVSKALAAFEVRLDSIEAQIAELESQDPSLEDDESAEFCPRTKQTIQMLLQDLETMEELARIT